jgi:hypothetical protein
MRTKCHLLIKVYLTFYFNSFEACSEILHTHMSPSKNNGVFNLVFDFYPIPRLALTVGSLVSANF